MGSYVCNTWLSLPPLPPPINNTILGGCMAFSSRCLSGENVDQRVNLQTCLISIYACFLAQHEESQPYHLKYTGLIINTHFMSSWEVGLEVVDNIIP